MTTHPEMVTRYDALNEHCTKQGWHLAIVSSTRDYAEQKVLYDAWRNGLRSAQAGNPDAPLYQSPWGWMAQGSLHQPQADGFSHALDLGWAGCSALDVANAATQYGLRLDVTKENWHFQWWDHSGIHDAPALAPPPPEEDDDMNKQEFADAIGAHIPTDGPHAGVACVHLIGDDVNNLEGSGQDWPVADAIKFVHQELKMKRLGVA